MESKLRLTVLLTGLLVICYVVYAAVSSGFSHSPSVLNYGGGQCTSDNYQALANADEGAVGISESSNYRSEAGFVYLLPGVDEEWLRITQLPNPAFIGTGGSLAFTWISDRDGSFEVSVNSTGTTIDYGTCYAGIPITQVVHESDLEDNNKNNVTVIVNSPPKQSSLLVGMTDDQIPPEVILSRITVSGSVYDDTVASVIVNGTTVSVIGNKYSAEVTTNLEEIVIEATNALGKTVTRTITVRREE